MRHLPIRTNLRDLIEFAPKVERWIGKEPTIDEQRRLLVELGRSQRELDFDHEYYRALATLRLLREMPTAWVNAREYNYLPRHGGQIGVFLGNDGKLHSVHLTVTRGLLRPNLISVDARPDNIPIPKSTLTFGDLADFLEERAGFSTRGRLGRLGTAITRRLNPFVLVL